MALQSYNQSEDELIKYVRRTQITDEKHLYKKPLGSDYLRMLNTEKKPLGLIVKTHLFGENFLDAILIKKLKHPDFILKNRNFTFSMKLDILRANNFLDEKLYNDVRNLNRLRNKFAHNLYYDLSQFDVTVFAYCEDYSDYFNSITRKSKIFVNVFVLKHIFFYLLVRLTIKHKYIGNIEVPKGAELHKS